MTGGYSVFVEREDGTDGWITRQHVLYKGPTDVVGPVRMRSVFADVADADAAAAGWARDHPEDVVLIVEERNDVPHDGDHTGGGPVG